jgi:hypothetical protein
LDLGLPLLLKVSSDGGRGSSTFLRHSSRADLGEDQMIDSAPGFRPNFGPLGPTAGPGSSGNGPGSKNSAGCTKQQPRRPIQSPSRGYLSFWDRPQKDKNIHDILCFAIVLPGRKSAFRARFWPDCHRERTENGPEGRSRWFPRSIPAKIQPGRPIFGPEALLRKTD